MAELKFSMNPGMKFPSRSVFGEAAENVAEAGDEADDAEDDHHGGLRVQPDVEEVAGGAAHHDASHENEGGLHRHRVLPRKNFSALGGGGEFPGRFILWFPGHKERAA